MTTRPISMSKLHSILRLKYSAQLSHREIARSLNISPGTVANYLKKANELGLNQWPIPEDKRKRLGIYTYFLTFHGNRLSISGAVWHSSLRQAMM